MKGSQGKRVGVQSARMSMATFTTPQRFLSEIWPKVVACRNGLADRILVLYQDRCHVDIEEMEEFSSTIQESQVKSMGTVYEQIYTEHHQEIPVEYSLNASARMNCTLSIARERAACSHLREPVLLILSAMLKLAKMHSGWPSIVAVAPMGQGPGPVGWTNTQSRD